MSTTADGSQTPALRPYLLSEMSGDVQETKAKNSVSVPDDGVNGFNGNPDEIKKVQLLSPGSGWGHKGHE